MLDRGGEQLVDIDHARLYMQARAREARFVAVRIMDAQSFADHGIEVFRRGALAVVK